MTKDVLSVVAFVLVIIGAIHHWGFFDGAAVLSVIYLLAARESPNSDHECDHD